MNKDRAARILRDLAGGIDIQTGQPLPKDSQLNQPDAIRALFVGIEALEAPSKETGEQKPLPPMAGGKWDEEELSHLAEAFEAGSSLEELAASHQRTTGAIRSRLVKLGYFEQLEARRQAAASRS